MLPLTLFARRNFAVANAQTLAMYGAIGILGFFVTIYLQQVAGYSALKSGRHGSGADRCDVLFSARMGRLADRFGSRPFLIAGPMPVACGFALMLRYGTSVSLLATSCRRSGVRRSVSSSPSLAAHRDRPRRRLVTLDAGIASAVNNATPHGEA